jgi:hypothetical protein
LIAVLVEQKVMDAEMRAADVPVEVFAFRQSANTSANSPRDAAEMSLAAPAERSEGVARRSRLTA